LVIGRADDSDPDDFAASFGSPGPEAAAQNE